MFSFSSNRPLSGATVIPRPSRDRSCSNCVCSRSDSLSGEAPKHNVSPPTGARDLDRAAPVANSLLDTEIFTFFFINLRGFVTHEAELNAVLVSLDYPTLVGLNETLLPGKNVVKEISLSGYVLVSRRDRPDHSGWGGIALFARQGYENCIVHVGDSEAAERSWHILHTDRGPVGFGLWYRPPRPGEVETIQALDAELQRYCGDCVGHILMGDFNVHEAAWLRYSAGTSREGRELHEFCAERGLEEHVGEPTRGEYLLDLVLSDLGSLVKAKTVPGIADHNGILGKFSFPLPEITVVEREFFQYSKANWAGLRRAISDTDWRRFIDSGDADASATNFEHELERLIRAYIPSRIFYDEKKDHAWLDDRCKEMVAAKRAAFGTDEYFLRRDECTRGLLQAYNDFVARTRAKLGNLKPSSREWWRISKSLLSMGSAREVIPPLRRPDGSWATTSLDKARLLADTFATKSRLDDEQTNDYSDIIPEAVAPQGGSARIRRRYVRRALKNLDEASATGPDGIASRVLRRCRSALELPIYLLAKSVFDNGRWPDVWRLHWIHPLYKKKSRADPNNYRGIHLTTQLSKVIERTIGAVFLLYANYSGSFGANQYAYSRKRSHKDALAVNVCNWLWILESGSLVGLYCSDVSGAFDRVRHSRIMAKLRASGLHPRVVRFLDSWLQDRKSVVLVGGSKTDEAELCRIPSFKAPCLALRFGISSTSTLRNLYALLVSPTWSLRTISIVVAD